MSSNSCFVVVVRIFQITKICSEVSKAMLYIILTIKLLIMLKIIINEMKLLKCNIFSKFSRGTLQLFKEGIYVS